MAIDVTTSVEIDVPRDVVSTYAADPESAAEWYRNIRSVEWQSEPEVRVGARVSFVARFLGRRLEYTYEIVDFVPGERLTMQTSAGPFPMRTEYSWEDAGIGRTKMTLRNSGSPSGLMRVTAPVMAAAVRRANSQDLALLKETLEAKVRQK